MNTDNISEEKKENIKIPRADNRLSPRSRLHNKEILKSLLNTTITIFINNILVHVTYKRSPFTFFVVRSFLFSLPLPSTLL